jgi:23S rRNA (cytosine1962-C5)-methyltransferase
MARYRFIRPEPQAMWRRGWTLGAHGEFVPGSDEDGGGRWQYDNGRCRAMAGRWRWGDVKFTAQCTPFRHLGFFPDMAPVWDWMGQRLDGAAKLRRSTCSAIPASARWLCPPICGPVTHVDASKKSVAQARVNAALSGMADRPVRWLVDDAAKFAAREVRRGKRYDGIILDPPKFGRGPEGEVWRLEEGTAGPDRRLPQLLDAESRFLFLTVYAVRMSSLALAGCSPNISPTCPARSSTAIWRCARKGRAAACCPPPYSPAGRNPV